MPSPAIPNSPAPAGNAVLAGKYLTVVLADEAYGISVLKVREIIRVQKITPVPQLPVFVKGVINLRGRVIPVVDLRARFALRADLTERSCMVVVQVPMAASAVVQTGLIVDAVEEVAGLTQAEIEPAPDFGTTVGTEYILGMAKVRDQVKLLLDIDRVISADAVRTIAPATK